MRMHRARRSLILFGALIALGAGGTRRGVAAQEAMRDADVQKLVERYMALAEAGRPGDVARAERRDLEKQLGPADVLTQKDVERWKPVLLRLAGKGPKLDLKGTNYLYDEKTKRGKYIASGKSSKSLVICLHGGGAGEGDAGSALSGFGGALSKAGVLAIYPEVLEKTEYGWGEDDTEQFVLDLIERAKRTRDLDLNRIYVTGHSMGGYGTWTIGARNADTFAGLAAFAGAPTPYFERGDESKSKVIGIQDGILPNLRNVPIFVYQSLDDPNVPPWSNLFATAELYRLEKEQGGFVHEFEKVDGRKHAFPEKGPYPGVAWALQHVRDPRPAKVLWQPFRPWKRMFYWLWWETPQPGALVTVERTAENTFAVATKAKSLDGFALLLDDRLADLSKEVVVSVNGEERFKGLVPRTLSTLLRTAAERNDPDLLFTARVDL